MLVTHRGVLTKEQMLELLKPGALDLEHVVGRRVRWAYATTRTDEKETRRVSDALKELHLQLGAFEVLVHHAPWLEMGSRGVR
jgi:hypothetical protein